MVTAGKRRRLDLGCSALYRIAVQGSLDSRCGERLGGMSIENRIDEDGEHEAILTGILADQAALSGVLNTLYELHRPILRVEFLRDHPRDANEEVGTRASHGKP